MADARLEVTDAFGQRTVTLDKPTFTIGRRDSNDLRLAGSEVSRDHADITFVDGRVLFRDRGSRYGSFVNGEQVTESPLTHGEREWLTLAARVMTSADIGVKLGIAERTANFHIANIIDKLGALNRGEAIARGVALNLVARP